jgi:predicted ribosomally synthesized peptide with SipW-like signal peptide
MSKTKTKRYLMLLAAVGLIAAGLGGTGTFASFTAETTNAGNYFATGTLFLHNNGGTTTCTSESTLANNATITGCDVLFHVAPLTSTSPVWAHLTLTNAGSIDSTDIKFNAPGGCSFAASTFSSTALAAPLPVSGNPVTTLHFASLSGSIAVGDAILVTEGTHAQTFTATAAAAATATSVSVASVTANFSYTTGATLSNAPTFTGAGNLCSQLQFMIVETGSNFNGDSPTGATSCSYGFGATNPTPPYTGCAFDSSKTLANLPDVSPVQLLDADNSTPTTLVAGQSRYFLIGIKPPASLTNAYQNRRAQFDLHWQIDQA